MANVVGLAVTVWLRNNTIVYGTVKDIVPNSHMILQDGGWAQ